MRGNVGEAGIQAIQIWNPDDKMRVLYCLIGYPSSMYFVSFLEFTRTLGNTLLARTRGV